jgi:hypothetical protein
VRRTASVGGRGDAARRRRDHSVAASEKLTILSAIRSGGSELFYFSPTAGAVPMRESPQGAWLCVTALQWQSVAPERAEPNQTKHGVMAFGTGLRAALSRRDQAPAAPASRPDIHSGRK